MSGVELAFSAIGTTDDCIRIGKYLIRKYRAFRNAEDELGELILILELAWEKIEHQIKILRSVWDMLPPKLQLLNTSLLHRLQIKLQDAVGLVDLCIGRPSEHVAVGRLAGKTGALNKVRYALRGKDLLKKSIEDLETWHDRFDPSWFLMNRLPSDDLDRSLADMRLSPGDSDSWSTTSTLVPSRSRSEDSWILEQHRRTEDPGKAKTSFSTEHQDWVSPMKNLHDTKTSLSTGDHDSVSTMKNLRDTKRKDSGAQSVFKDPSFLDSSRTPIPFSSMQLSKEAATAQPVIVDTISPNRGSDPQRTRTEVRSLARVLSRIDPRTFGLMLCCGVIPLKKAHTKEPPAYEFIFSIPASLSTPQTLRALLLQGPQSPPHTLNQRFALATRLANSVTFVHSAGFVHKNIRPDTIVVFASAPRGTLASAFLVGFEKFRPAEGHTLMLSDSRWDRDLYRHPSRQGARPDDEYKMQHDIYSLGVCLLEIGLWASFVQRDDGDDAHAETPPRVGAVLDIAAEMAVRSARQRAFAIKERLVRMAQEMLPLRMGEKYADIVVSCLTCLDRGNDGFGDESEFVDEDGVLVGVRFIESILLRVQEISV